MFKTKKLQRNVNETKKEKCDNENRALNKENKSNFNQQKELTHRTGYNQQGHD